jgi:hypothetical protein
MRRAARHHKQQSLTNNEGAHGRHKRLHRFLRFRQAALRQRPQGSDAVGVDVLKASKRYCLHWPN